MSLGLRDLEYVEVRLAAPAMELVQAVERLHQRGEYGPAARLRNALSALLDECREVRDELRERERERATSPN